MQNNCRDTKQLQRHKTATETQNNHRESKRKVLLTSQWKITDGKSEGHSHGDHYIYIVGRETIWELVRNYTESRSWC